MPTAICDNSISSKFPLLLPLYLCDICGMYFEAVLRFYVFLNHLICNSLFRLVRFGSLGNIIKRHFAFTLAKLDFYINYAVVFLLESIATVSTCTVPGNMSTQHILSTRYPISRNTSKSRARLVGLHEI